MKNHFSSASEHDHSAVRSNPLEARQELHAKLQSALPQPADSKAGPQYWRGLDELAETPEFKEWASQEFGEGASEFADPVSRRHFIQIMSASFLLAGIGLTGCRRPEQKILPFAQQPENYIHGVPQFYATSMPTRSGAVPLLVRANDGRPTKVEGNPVHPINHMEGQGGSARKSGPTDHYAQASVLSLYDPDRAIRFTKGGAEIAREAAFDFLHQLGVTGAANGGKGVAFLLQRSSSPSRGRLIQGLRQQFPQAGWFVHEPVDFHIHQQAASLAFGRPVRPWFRLDRASIILSLDCDFIGSEENTVQFCREFARSRKAASPAEPMSRLYVLESLMSLTGSNADHRLRIPAGAIPAATAYVALRILGNQAGELTGALQQAASAVNEKEGQWLAKCAEDLLKPENKGKSVIMAGYRQPLAVHLLACAMNSALGNIGNTFYLQEAGAEPFGSAADLAARLNAGAVDTLIILGANPVYDAPSDLNWAAAQRKAKTVVRCAYYEDETGALCDYHYPATHYLEEWGDARSFDGTLVSVQPLIAPLFAGMTELEFLGRISGLDKPAPYEIVRETFRTFAPNGDFEEKWKKYLHDGFLPNSSARTAQAQVDPAALSKALAFEAYTRPSLQQMEVVFYRDYSVDDGRWNNNGWLQEVPDPVTKLSWENAILVSPQTAKELGLLSKDIKETRRIGGQVVQLTVGGKTIEGPAWIQPGQADNVVALALGYGRERTGRIGRGSGYNAYPLRTSKNPYSAPGGKMVLTPVFHELACTQSHWSQEGRPMVREANLAQFRHHPQFAQGLDWEEVPDPRSIYPNPLENVKSAQYQWGMAIDLQACVGCHACVIACQSENNVPIVGKLMVGKSREMHWLRIDRYYAGSVEDPQVVNQPMLCQHCEAAPCENVCPVNATVHDTEGLNLMVYNRCVGTRYCSNNCPWKIRRFNFFDYNRRPLGKDLYKSPLSPFNRVDGEWEFTRWVKDPARGSRPEEEWELIKMVKNPDVTVRMRGVMEKCTFCVQRIEAAKISQKVKAGASGDVQVPEGTFTTACAQACPTDAIVFGNLLEPKSQVLQLKKHQRNYSTLEFLHTRPRVSYMGKVRNPNPDMPDYYKTPHSMKTYEALHGNAFEEHGPAETAPRFGTKPEKGAM